MFSKLGIDLTSLIIYLVNFFLLLAVLYFIGYKPILRVLDQRSARVRESLTQAEKVKEETARLEKEMQARLEEARKEGQKFIALAQETAEKIKEEGRQQARQEAEIILERARAKIQAERNQAIEELRREFADLAIRAAERVIHRSLDRAAHRQLIEDVMRQAPSEEKG